MTVNYYALCCGHGTDDADYCCMCAGSPCQFAKDFRDPEVHDGRIGREAMERSAWQAAHPEEAPF